MHVQERRDASGYVPTHFHVRTLKTAVWRFEYRANKTVTRVKLERNLEVLYMPMVGEKTLHRNKSRREVILLFFDLGQLFY